MPPEATPQQPEDPCLSELSTIDPDLIPILREPDAASKVIDALVNKYTPAQVQNAPGNRAWELAGLFLLNRSRSYEALAVFSRLYEHMLDAQKKAGRVHKGMVLLWISECFFRLNFPVHAKRHLMLTLSEDAISSGGRVSPTETGVYFRLVWRHGLADEQLQRYAHELYQLSKGNPEEALFPEALVRHLDDKWVTELPSQLEAFSYRINTRYAQHLLTQIDNDPSGKKLELLASYLMSCIPGCRVSVRRRSPSTDYDLVCSVDGIEVDFRSEFGRYFVCECKDLDKPADFTAMAKFCRVLDSTKSRFGILFSTRGISGAENLRDAAREQMKIFQDRGIVIVILDRNDLSTVAGGANLIALLRERYEAIRLDLQT